MPGEDLIAFLISASLGALIGLERQWEEQRDGVDSMREPAAGLRTFLLWALLGTAAALIQRDYAPGFFPASFVIFALGLLAQGLFAGRTPHPLGFTTISAGLLTFLIGALCLWEERRLAVVLGITTVLVLGSKRPIHQISAKFTQADVRSGLTFLAITGIVLPLAPNVDYGPYGAFNPFKIWLMVVLVTGLGFFGYLAMRLMGPRAGIGTMGILGGLASSTATTLAFSRQSKDRPALSTSFAMGIVLACTIMLGRVAVLVALTERSILAAILPWLVAMCIPGVAYTLWHFFRGKSKQDGDNAAPDLSNPLSLSVGIKFALLYALIILFARAGDDHFGATGVEVVSLISGLTDMDAIALSLSGSVASGSIPPGTAAGGILLAAASNTLLKGGFALVYGSSSLRLPILLVFIPTLCIGVAGWFFGR